MTEQDTQAQVKALCQELAEWMVECPRVRVPCPTPLWGQLTPHTLALGRLCPNCHGKGWVASTDMGTWLLAGLDKWGKVKIEKVNGRYRCWVPTCRPVWADNLHEALLLALKEMKEKQDA